MAIDKQKTKELLDTIDSLFENTVGEFLPANVLKFLRQSIMGPALDEIRTFIQDSRSPVLMLAGRSGHGKSSLINALSGMDVAQVGDIKPTTPGSQSFSIEFPEQFSAWQMIDSRGFFESTRPDGALEQNPEEVFYNDVLEYKPDVIVHVISAPEIRNLENDLALLKKIQNRLKTSELSTIPVITVINKADTLGNPRDWPPERSPEKNKHIIAAMDYLTQDVLKVDCQTLDPRQPLSGYISKDPTYPGVIPVCSLAAAEWNIAALQDFIGRQLPQSSLLEYYQSIKRKDELKKISSKIIKRFAFIASGIGASPAPLSDFLALIPLQMLMIAIVGGLSCKPVSKDTAMEYLSAAGINLAATGGVRYLSRQILKLIPFGGWAAAGSMAGSSTWAIGKAAESFFFSGEIVGLSDFKIEWGAKSAGPA